MQAWWPLVSETAVQVWQWGGKMSTSAVASAIAMPAECHSSVLHAITVCAGMPSKHFATAGFAPFAVCWGWLLVGAGFGVLCCCLLAVCLHLYGFTVVRIKATGTGSAPGLIAFALQLPNLSPQQRELLQRLHSGGPDLISEVVGQDGDAAGLILKIVHGQNGRGGMTGVAPPPALVRQY